MGDSRDQPEAFRTTRRVEFADTDMAGIAHFSAFFRWMEAAEHELLRSLGVSIYTELAPGVAISFPRVHAECDYRSPARCEEVLEVQVTVERLGSKSVSYATRFLLGERLVAEGKMTAVCCRLQPGEKPVSVTVPDEIATGLRRFVVC